MSKVRIGASCQRSIRCSLRSSPLGKSWGCSASSLFLALEPPFSAICISKVPKKCMKTPRHPVPQNYYRYLAKERQKSTSVPEYFVD